MTEGSFKVVRDRIKLTEELKEYLESKKLEEFADLLEIIYRIAELRGFSKDELEALRLKKKEENGEFENNLVLLFPFEERSLFSVKHPVTSEKSRSVVFGPENAEVIEKHGVRMKIYTTKSECENAAIIYQETDKGHAEEFLHEKSDFIYYILEGSGTWIVEDKEFMVRAGDVVVVTAGRRFWFRGNLRQICVTAPAWEERYEHHVRDLNL